MKARRLLAGLVCVLAMIATPVANAADPPRDTHVPAGLTHTVSGLHVVVHYGEDVTPGYASSGLEDFEESYSREVTSGSGTPNAGLRVPIADDDAKTDVYLAVPADDPSFRGGIVYTDTAAPFARYVLMAPDLSRYDFRFRAAHEFMHVIQGAYTARISLLTESTANWAAEFALPDIDAGDNNFSHPGATQGATPWLPLDCSYGTFTVTAGETRDCGNGYWQWLFIQQQTERYGAAIVDALLTRIVTRCNNPPGSCPFNPIPSSIDGQILDDEIKAQSGNADSIRTQFAAYARDVWDPTRWTTSAVAAIQSAYGYAESHQPRSYEWDASTADTGSQSVAVDHLATRYVHVRNDNGYLPTGPDDQLEITVARSMATAVTPIARAAGAVGWTDLAVIDATPGGTITVPFDPALRDELVVPLVNDTLATDGAAMSYRIRRLPGTPTPPANDLAANSTVVALGGTAATTNDVYAGGQGNVDEATSCGPAQDATRGVWYRFTTPNSGTYTYDATASDDSTVVSLYNRANGAFVGCSAFGTIGSTESAGTTYDVYVGRVAGAVGYGHGARLLVTGPGAPPPGGTPPANDLRSGPLAVSLGQTATTDTADATGAGGTEAPDCPFAAGATHGVWFRFSTPNTGTYRYDGSASDFGAVLSLYDATSGEFAGCSGNGVFSGVQAIGHTYDVYLGRASGAAGANIARLGVTGPAAPAAAPAPPAAPADTGVPPNGTTVPADDSGPTHITVSAACRTATTRASSAQRALAKAKRAQRAAHGRTARRRAAAKVKRLTKALKAARSARTHACS